MTRDQDLVKRLQQRLPNWNPDSVCKVHTSWEEQCCKYDENGELFRLHFCGLELQQILSEIWEASSLKELYLSENELSSVPKEIGNLSGLRWLTLDGNQLSSVPKEIGNLASLQELNLSRNELSSVPKEIGNLSGLQNLYLNGNQLSSVPKEIGNLTGLQWLYLSRNQLSSVPKEIGNLTGLQGLYLNGNQLSSVPKEVGKLTALRVLYLDGNPLQVPPPEIVEQVIPVILEYLRRLSDELDEYLASQRQHLSSRRTLISPLLNTIDIFYSYDHEDEALRIGLEKHLSALRSLHIIADWHDRNIAAGENWQITTSKYLDRAHIILLLISPDFMASEYRYGEEMRRAMQHHASGKARVIPVLLRPVDWHGTPFSSLKFLPGNGQPVTTWPNPDSAFVDIVQGIRGVIQEILNARLHSVQEQSARFTAQLNTLRKPYTQAEDAIQDLADEQEQLAEESTRIEAEIAALQKQLQSIQQQRNDLSLQQSQREWNRQNLQQTALEIRRNEIISKQEADQIREQIKRVE